MGQRYQVIGIRGAGSLIVEFMLTAVGKVYDITTSMNCGILGKVPGLICPDGQTICDTLAITVHFFEAFAKRAPPVGNAARRHYAAMLATCVCPAYHCQHRTEYYAPESAFDAVRALPS